MRKQARADRGKALEDCVWRRPPEKRTCALPLRNPVPHRTTLNGLTQKNQHNLRSKFPSLNLENRRQADVLLNHTPMQLNHLARRMLCLVKSEAGVWGSKTKIMACLSSTFTLF
jgi:hypothetical protein